MCLYPRFIKNPAYSKQKYLRIGCVNDERKKWVAIGCGNCYECKRQKAQSWRVRLIEELKVQKHPYFITLTFENNELKKLCDQLETENKDTNAVATKAVRLFLERWRKQHKKSLRHWLITELGHENTERIHLHGIIFPEEEINVDYLQKFWKYGKCDIGKYCNLQTINYIVKYVTKIDNDHKHYKPVILCSAGLGSAFVQTLTAKNTYKYRPHKTTEYYTLNNGQKVALPIYYRNKLFSEKERSKLWTERLDKAEIFVNGIRIRKVNTIQGETEYYETLKTQQEWNTAIGYGSTDNEWKKEPYNVTFKMLQSSKVKV